MIRELITMFWGWRRDAAEAAGRKVLDPEGPTFLFLSWIFCPKDKSKGKKKGRIPRGPVRERGEGHYRWICTGCGMGGSKPGLGAARSDADHHAALHNFEHRYGLESRPGEWPASAMR